MLSLLSTHNGVVYFMIPHNRESLTIVFDPKKEEFQLIPMKEAQEKGLVAKNEKGKAGQIATEMDILNHLNSFFKK